MARTRIAIEKTPGWKIYNALLKYVDSKQMIPNVSSFFSYLVEEGVLSATDKSLCRYYMERRFVEDGLIEIDYKRHAFRLLEREIVPLKTNEVETEAEPIVKKRLQDW